MLVWHWLVNPSESFLSCKSAVQNINNEVSENKLLFKQHQRDYKNYNTLS